jgi:hypothetical protein
MKSYHIRAFTVCLKLSSLIISFNFIFTFRILSENFSTENASNDLKADGNQVLSRQKRQDDSKPFSVRLEDLKMMSVGEINKVAVLVQSQKNETASVTLTIDGGKFEFVEVHDGKCREIASKSSTKTVEVSSGKEVAVPFYVKLIDDGDFELKVQGKAGSESDFVSKKVRTFGVSEKRIKFFDLRNKKYDSYYIDEENKGTYETQINVTGSLMGDKLKSFGKLL